MRRIQRAILSAAVAAALAGCRETPPNVSAATPAATPPGVAVVSISPERVELTGEWLATLDGNVNAQIRPQVSGYLVKRTYREGGSVRKGDVLFEIDRRPFENALLQAKAHLAESRAQLGKADRDLARDRPLAAQRAIAQSQLDDDLSARDAAQAALESSEAAVQIAQLNVGFTHVTSLIDGVAAIATAQIGDLVGPQTLLTTVSQLDPIKAYFPLSEQEYLGIASQLGASGGPSRLWQAQGGLTLVLADGSTHPKRGAILAVDREVDPKMGTIRISAIFPNPGNVLRPGQGARIRAQTSVRSDALLVPQRAVSELQNGFQLRVLTPDNHVAIRTVTLGRRAGSRWIVESGLKAGEQVIVEGPALKDGAAVTPHPYAPPAGAQ
jgi:membrane fusion protein (multidrug efflux system)